MKNITFIAGLPGSGKSNYIKEYIKSRHGFFYIVDDYNASMLDFLKDMVTEHDNVLVLSIDFCNSSFLKNVKEEVLAHLPSLNIETIYFENNPTKCIINLIERSKNRGDIFETLKNGTTVLIGDLVPTTRQPGVVSDIQKVLSIWQDYHIDMSKTIVPVYSKYRVKT